MCPASSGILAKLVCKFTGDSTHSELLSLSPELDVDVMLLSGLAGNLGVSVGPSFVN